MLDTIHGRLAAATWPTVVLLAVGFVACGLLFDRRSRAMGDVPKIADVRRFGYTPGELKGVFEAWGPANRMLYARTQLTLDTAFPLIYGALLAIPLARLFPAGNGRYVILLPLLAVAADLVENLILAALAWTYTGAESPAARLASAATLTKFTAIAASLALIPIGGVLRMVRRGG